MSEVHHTPLDDTEREPRWVSQQEGEEGFEAGLAGVAPRYMEEDSEELAATQTYKRVMLDDAASLTSLRKGGARLLRAAQVRRERVKCISYVFYCGKQVCGHHEWMSSGGFWPPLPEAKIAEGKIAHTCAAVGATWALF